MNNNEPTTSTIPQFSLVDNTTGEIINQYYPGDTLNVTRKSQSDYVNNYILNFNQNESFIKVYDKAIPLLEKYLNPPEFKFAICLGSHVSYKDCIIRETQNTNSKVLTIKDLANFHGYRYDYARKMMSILKSKGVVGKHETGSILPDYNERYGTVYTVNPFIYFRGSALLNPVHSFYINSGWQELLSGKDTNVSSSGPSTNNSEDNKEREKQ